MPRLPAMLVFLGVFTALIASSHAYIVARLALDTHLPEPFPAVAIAAVSLFGVLLVAQPFASRILAPRVARYLAWPAFTWMGLCFYLLLSLGFTDLLQLLLGDGSLDAARLQAVACGTISLGAVAAGMAGALGTPGYQRVGVRIASWPASMSGFRIVQISDIHIGAILGRDFAERVTRAVNALEPDLIAVTGDVVDGQVEHLADHVAPFAQLSARHGVFFVTGNHEYYSGMRAWSDKLSELGLRRLDNERVSISDASGAFFELAGVNDQMADRISRRGEDLPAALAGRDGKQPLVLLAHNPMTFDRALSLDIDLQLSGHTHGGQLWPFNHLVKLQTRWVAGLYRRGRAQLYVSRGTGFWGPPMRIGAPAEITEIRVERESETA
jgi:predicted MPP superfamily phosphohydrolase